MRRLDRFELVLLGLFALLSLWVVFLDGLQVVVHGRVWTGTDGVYIVDQMQYLSWIRSASQHVLSANLFVLRGTPADYFQPAVALSGGLVALGVAPTLALLLWKPVAVVACFFAVRAFVHHSLAGVSERRMALTLALFFASFTVAYGSFTTLGDLFVGFLSWGYTFGLLATAALVGTLVLHGRDREGSQITLWPGLLGALASLLHPWHGELLVLILIGGEAILWSGRRRARLAPVLITLGLTALPLLLYAVLGKVDLSWKLAREASKHSFSLWPIVIYLVPLALPALLALRRRPQTFVAAATRAWPVAALLLFVLSATALGATPLHAVEGITIPLGVLAVEGVRELKIRHPARLGWAAVALATIPGTVMQMKTARDLAAPTAENANFIRPSERDALDYLARAPALGGVLTRSYLGATVPSRTGRRTFIGDCLWSEPGCLERTDLAQRLFSGLLSASQVRTLVQDSGARYLLADCEAQPGFQVPLAPLIRRTARFGCATVIELRAPGPARGPLADSARDAAVRPAWRQ